MGTEKDVKCLIPRDLRFKTWGQIGGQKARPFKICKGESFDGKYLSVDLDWEVERTSREQSLSKPLDQCHLRYPDLSIEMRVGAEYEVFLANQFDAHVFWKSLQERKLYRMNGTFVLRGDEIWWIVIAPHDKVEGIEDAIQNNYGTQIVRALLQ